MASTSRLDQAYLAASPVDPSAVRVDQFDDDLWALRLPLPMPRVPRLNAYLLRGRHGWILVDCGTRRAPLELAMAHTPADLRDIQSLVITHPHSDHSALAAELVDEFDMRLVRGRGQLSITDPLRDPGVPLSTRRRSASREGVPERDLPLLVEKRVADHGEEDPGQADQYLGGGDRLDDAEHPWTAIPLPGHSATQIGLWDPVRSLMICSDATYPRTVPYLEWCSSPDPLQDHLSSLQRLERLGIATLLPGHGPPDHDVGHRLDSSRQVVVELRDRILDHVRAREATTAYDVVRWLVAGDPDPDHSQSLLSTVLVVLEHLAAAGRLASDDDHGIRRFSRRHRRQACTT